MTDRINTFQRVEIAAHDGDFGNNQRPTPSDAMAVAGNYKVGRTTIFGLPVSIEQPRYSYRTGIDKNGKRWTSRLAAHYGYFTGTKSTDGDAVDCFIGYFPLSDDVYIINQYVNGSFDEFKVMLFFPDIESAKKAYLDSYDKGWTGLRSIVKASVTQLKWWLKYGNKKKPLAPEHLPFDGYETMARIQWDSANQPEGMTIDKLLYEIRRADGNDNLLLDSVSMADILEEAESVMTFDALVSSYAKLERKMNILKTVMERAGASVKPVAMQISDPFKQNGVAQVAVIFELSDGQTITIYFHNPDVTPAKIAPSDDVISWKWLMNKKDITILAAPEKGDDLNVREVALRIMKLAEKNSALFQRANAKRAEKMQAIESIKEEIVVLEKELVTVQHELEVAKVEAESSVRGIDSVDGEVIQGGKFDGFKLIAQSALGVKSPLVNVYGLSGRIIGVVHRDDVDIFKEGNGKALQPIGGWMSEFSNELKEKLGLSGHIVDPVDIAEPDPTATDPEVVDPDPALPDETSPVKYSVKAKFNDEPGAGIFGEKQAFYCEWKSGGKSLNVAFVGASDYDKKEFGLGVFRAGKGEMQAEVIAKIDPKGMKLYFPDNAHYTETDEVKWDEPVKLTNLIIFNKALFEKAFRPLTDDELLALQPQETNEQTNEQAEVTQEAEAAGAKSAGIIEPTVGDPSFDYPSHDITSHLNVLQGVIDGKNDGDNLDALLNSIDAAATAIIEHGDGEKYDKLIGDAAEKWAALDQKANG